MAARDRPVKLLRNAFERLPEGTRENLKRTRAEFRGLGQLKANQALLAKRLALVEQQLMGPAVAAPAVPDARFPDEVRSRLCTQSQIEAPWFARWCHAMGEKPVRHRKHWEFAYIARVVEELGLLQDGRRGVGFGVGREPLVSAFANLGVEVLATDLAAESKAARGWIRSDQHADDIQRLLRPGTCDPDQFRRLVSWRAVDMTAIPTDLSDFDFCWSACALEHLGTLDAGLDFIEASLATLKPGGIAVHTTEFNLTSNDETIEVGPTVIYRERDMIALKSRLEAAGHEVAAFDFSQGEGLLDQYVDVPPYSDEPVLRFWYASHALTSVAIVVRTRRD